MQDGIAAYLTDIGRIPMLSPDEQILLGTAVRRWLDDPAPSAGVARRGKRALDRMVTANLRLVIAWAKRYRNKGLSMEDLVQEGNIGLVRGAEKYDPSTGYRFSTYATWWIRQALTRAISNQATTIRRASSAVARRNKVNAFVAAFQQEHHRQPSWEEIAEELAVPVEGLRSMMESVAAAEAITSLDARVAGDDTLSTYAELIASPGEDPLEQLDYELAWEQVQGALSEMPASDRRLLEAEFNGVRRTVGRRYVEAAEQRLVQKVRGGAVPLGVTAPTITLSAVRLAEQLDQLDLLAA